MARRDLARRLDRLEQKADPGLHIIWCKEGESEAEARHRYEDERGTEAKGVVLILSWEDAAA